MISATIPPQRYHDGPAPKAQEYSRYIPGVNSTRNRITCTGFGSFIALFSRREDDID
jgi:hypothetical protein